MQFWRLLCTVPTSVAFFNNQRKDLKDPRHSSCPEAVWDAYVKLYPIIHLPDLSCVCWRWVCSTYCHVCVGAVQIALGKSGSHKTPSVLVCNALLLLLQNCFLFRGVLASLSRWSEAPLSSAFCTEEAAPCSQPLQWCAVWDPGHVTEATVLKLAAWSLTQGSIFGEVNEWPVLFLLTPPSPRLCISVQVPALCIAGEHFDCLTLSPYPWGWSGVLWKTTLVLCFILHQKRRGMSGTKLALQSCFSLMHFRKGEKCLFPLL